MAPACGRGSHFRNFYTYICIIYIYVEYIYIYISFFCLFVYFSLCIYSFFRGWDAEYPAPLYSRFPDRKKIKTAPLYPREGACAAVLEASTGAKKRDTRV